MGQPEQVAVMEIKLWWELRSRLRGIRLPQTTAMLHHGRPDGKPKQKRAIPILTPLDMCGFRHARGVPDRYFRCFP